MGRQGSGQEWVVKEADEVWVALPGDLTSNKAQCRRDMGERMGRRSYLIELAVGKHGANRWLQRSEGADGVERMGNG